MKYKIIVNYETTIEAESEEEAIGAFFEGIENEPQQNYASFLGDCITVVEPECEHSFVDDNNDSKQMCRFCGFIPKE